MAPYKFTNLDFSPLPKGRPKRLYGVMTLVPVALGGGFLAPYLLPQSPIVGYVALASYLYLGFATWKITQLVQAWNERKLQLQRFAEVNNLVYFPLVPTESRPGSIFTHGHSRRFGGALGGKLSGFSFLFYPYSYVVGSGKHQRKYDAMVMEITLPRILPHLVIDSLVEGGNGLESTLPITFDKSQRMQLEGDFYKYFNVYAPDSYSISALTIIAPDVMLTLLQHASLCDIEVVGNKLYFYWPEMAYTRADYKNAFSTVENILDKIGDKLVQGNIFKNDSQAALHATPQGRGARLQLGGGSFVFAVSAIVSYFAFIIFFPVGPWKTLLMSNIELVVVLLVVIISIIKYFRRQSLRRELARTYNVSWDTDNFGKRNF